MTKITTISGQRYRDDEIVEAKRAAKDYVVFVSPAFVFEGETYRVITDGHHSYEAAILDGVEPEWMEQTATENDLIGMLNAGRIHDFLEANYQSDYYDITTGRDVW